MKDRSDFELEAPTDLREIILDEVREAKWEQYKQGEEVVPLKDENIEDLLQRVYAHIERQALDVYKSNEPWALKAWAYSTILRGTIASEATEPMVEELVSPVVEWQDKQPFDPVSYYRDRLGIERKSYRTVKGYMVTATRLVSRLGRKRHYTDEDVIGYLTWVNKNMTQATYQQECVRLMQFLRRLPGADRNRQLPIPMPKAPDDYYQPTFTTNEIESLIWSTVLDDIPCDMVVRLLVASVYGARVSELTELSSEDISLDGDNSTIYIRTKKGGQKKPQPIPLSLVPLFDVPINPIPGQTLQYRLKRICKKAGVQLPFKGGFHCFRRRVATTVFEVEKSEITVHDFMRWSKPRQYSMLARYRQTPVEQSDRSILERHPFVKMWEEIKPHLFNFNKYYNSLNDNTK